MVGIDAIGVWGQSEVTGLTAALPAPRDQTAIAAVPRVVLCLWWWWCEWLEFPSSPLVCGNATGLVSTIIPSPGPTGRLSHKDGWMGGGRGQSRGNYTLLSLPHPTTTSYPTRDGHRILRSGCEMLVLATSPSPFNSTFGVWEARVEGNCAL